MLALGPRLHPERMDAGRGLRRPGLRLAGTAVGQGMAPRAVGAEEDRRRREVEPPAREPGPAPHGVELEPEGGARHRLRPGGDLVARPAAGRLPHRLGQRQPAGVAWGIEAEAHQPLPLHVQGDPPQSLAGGRQSQRAEEGAGRPRHALGVGSGDGEHQARDGLHRHRRDPGRLLPPAGPVETEIAVRGHRVGERHLRLRGLGPSHRERLPGSAVEAALDAVGGRQRRARRREEEPLVGERPGAQIHAQQPAVLRRLHVERIGRPALGAGGGGLDPRRDLAAGWGEHVEVDPSGRQMADGGEIERHPHPARGRHRDLAGVVKALDVAAGARGPQARDQRQGEEGPGTVPRGEHGRIIPALTARAQGGPSS